MKISYYSKSNLNFIEVENDLDLKVVFCDLGASIFNIYFHNECMTRNVRRIEDFKEPSCYYGKTIGRTSNRLKGHLFDIHDVIYNLENNEGWNTLHGGKSGFSNQLFKPVVDTFEDYVRVTFSYFSKHLEGGYPGNVNIIVTYFVYKDHNYFDVDYQAISDMDTLFSLTNHSYFCLGDNDISNLQLFIRGHKYLNVDKANLLAKNIRDVNEIMDFTKYPEREPQEGLRDRKPGNCQGPEPQHHPVLYRRLLEAAPARYGRPPSERAECNLRTERPAGGVQAGKLQPVHRNAGEPERARAQLPAARLHPAEGCRRCPRGPSGPAAPPQSPAAPPHRSFPAVHQR